LGKDRYRPSTAYDFDTLAADLHVRGRRARHFSGTCHHRPFG
jgi:hypothetical protein